MEKRGTKLVLICLFLIGVYMLAREAALVSGKNHNRDPGKMILVDAGHGGTDPGMIGVGGLKEKEIDTLILGCTHYPLLSEKIDKYFDHKVKLINSGVVLADELNNDCCKEPNVEFYVSGELDSFKKQAKKL